MTKARSDGLRLLILGIAVFLLFGAVLQHTAKDSMADFKSVFYASRALLLHHDPYNPAVLSHLYRSRFGEADFISHHKAMAFSVYFPTTFFLIAPFAMLPWWIASLLWSVLTLASLIVAACLIWRVGADHAPVLAGALIGFGLANSAVVLANGNPAGIVVGLCVIAAWSFVTGRLVLFGILCLAVSLVVKPQDAGLIWLFFLLRSGALRKHALQTVAITVLLGLAAGLGAWRLAPHWIPEMRSNLAEVSVRGGNSDPGPAGLTNNTGTMEVITDLQTVISVFRDSPLFYNSLSFLICGVFLLVWMVVTLKSDYSPTLAWTALAVIAPLTLLVSYHRAYDARLLFLSVPACAILWAAGGPKGKIALAVTGIAFLFTGEIPLAFITPHTKNLHIAGATVFGKIGMIFLARPAALSLLAMSLFYLWIYVSEYRSAKAPATPALAGQ